MGIGDVSYDDNKQAFAMMARPTVTDMTATLNEFGGVYYCTELGKVRGKLQISQSRIFFEPDDDKQ